MVLDFDGIADRIPDVIEDVRYPNHCLSPKVMTTEEADIGEWTDDHPLNNRTTQYVEFERLFKEKP